MNHPEGKDAPGFSVVVPVMNEQESVPELAAEITAACDGMGCSWECIWVNDGSSDGTLNVLKGLCKGTPHRYIDLDGNFGQSAALAVGICHARGAAVGTLDGDGQNDPADFPALMERLNKGDVDVVNGVRANRSDSFVRKLRSRIGTGFRNCMTSEKVTDVGCSLRVFRRECFEGVFVFKGMHRYLPTLMRIRGYRITEMPVNHRPRTKGVTKYGIGNRLWVGIKDTMAVRWMKQRIAVPRVRTCGGEE
jgi:glycosyltransferase involved in cell wall biosynthesis